MAKYFDRSELGDLIFDLGVDEEELHMADRIFLQRVGGGWVFIHHSLLEYFASDYFNDKVRDCID